MLKETKEKIPKQAIIGKYFPTKRLAEKEIIKNYYSNNREIVKFKKGYLVVTQKQLKYLLRFYEKKTTKR